MNVRNAANKEFGEVNNLVIDMDTGKIRYVALSYNDKLYAVPWNGFHCEYSQSDDEYYLRLSVDEAMFKNAQGFTEDHWPPNANPQFRTHRDNRPAARGAELPTNRTERLNKERSKTNE